MKTLRSKTVNYKSQWKIIATLKIIYRLTENGITIKNQNREKAKSSVALKRAHP